MNDTIIEDADEPVVEVWTHPQVAKYLGIHRTTLLRLEQSGKIPPAKWIRSPRVCRIYTREDVALIKSKLDTLTGYDQMGQSGYTLTKKALVLGLGE